MTGAATLFVGHHQVPRLLIIKVDAVDLVGLDRIITLSQVISITEGGEGIKGLAVEKVVGVHLRGPQVALLWFLFYPTRP